MIMIYSLVANVNNCKMKRGGTIEGQCSSTTPTSTILHIYDDAFTSYFLLAERACVVDVYRGTSLNHALAVSLMSNNHVKNKENKT